jgi:uncharacterized phage protein gp47/JayE
MRFSTPLGVEYESLEPVTLGASGSPTPVRVRALDAGAIGNLDPGSRVGVGYNRPVNVDDSAVVITMTGGADEESDDQLRFRVLQRIREPPVGGAQHDYVNWVLRVPGVTRAWASPLEMGMGTVTVRFLMDDLRASNSPPGWPLPEDIAAVRNYLNTVRPVAVKDFFVEAPIPQPIDVHINRLVSDDAATRAAIEASLKEMLFAKAEPGQTIFAAWKTYAIMSAPGVVSFDLGNCDVDDVMPSPGHMAILGNVTYGV